MGDPVDIERERVRAAAGRSYVGYAVLVLVLYFVMYVPGLIANIVFYLQASEDQKLTGRSPDGKGCLVALLVFGVVMPVIAICMAMAVFGMFASV